jgi:hypothetical protein
MSVARNMAMKLMSATHLFAVTVPCNVATRAHEFTFVETRRGDTRATVPPPADKKENRGRPLA